MGHLAHLDHTHIILCLIGALYFIVAGLTFAKQLYDDHFDDLKSSRVRLGFLAGISSAGFAVLMVGAEIWPLIAIAIALPGFWIVAYGLARLVMHLENLPASKPFPVAKASLDMVIFAAGMGIIMLASIPG